MKIPFGSTILIATHNQGKAAEFRTLLQGYDIKVLLSSDQNIAEEQETGTTFAENALIKAKSAATQSGLICIADDSGLEVKALEGRPGIFSARFANGNYEKAMQTLYDEAALKNDFSARFVCVIAVAFPDKTTETFTGTVQGKICWPPEYGHGFGYDPFFIPDGYDKPFAVLDSSIKQSISHRHNALELFLQECLIK